MFTFLIKGLFPGFAVQLVDEYGRAPLQLLEIEAAKCGVRGLRLARLWTMGLIGLLAMMGVIALGLVVFHVGLFILLPWSMKTKAIIGVVLGLAYMLTGILVLRRFSSEKRWMKRSGVADFVEKAVCRQPA